VAVQLQPLRQHTNTHTHTHRDSYSYPYSYSPPHTLAHTHSHTRTHAHTCTRTRMHKHKHTHTYAHAHARTHPLVSDCSINSFRYRASLAFNKPRWPSVAASPEAHWECEGERTGGGLHRFTKKGSSLPAATERISWWVGEKCEGGLSVGVRVKTQLGQSAWPRSTTTYT
jgi:hypothetical protein